MKGSTADREYTPRKKSLRQEEYTACEGRGRSRFSHGLQGDSHFLRCRGRVPPRGGALRERSDFMLSGSFVALSLHPLSSRNGLPVASLLSWREVSK